MTVRFEMFGEWARKINSLNDKFQEQVEKWVQEQIASGRFKEDILKELKDSEMNNGEGILNTILSQTEGNKSLKTFPAGSDLVRWTLSPQSEQRHFPNGVKFCDPEEVPEWPVHPDTPEWYKQLKDGHCSSCLHQASLGPRDLMLIPVPGSQPTVGETNCGIDCCCELIPLLPYDEL
jgi:hypothetical protein